MIQFMISKKTVLRFKTLLIKCLCCLLLLSVVMQASAQNRKDLEEKRKKIVKDIQVTEKLLKKTTKTKEATFDRFIALQNQIQSRESLIQTVGEEITAADESISRNNAVVGSLAIDIERMQQEYGKMVRNAFRRKTLSNPLLYILSAESLNQAFRRWLFLIKYDRYRKEQAEAIRFTRDVLSKRTTDLQKTKTEKENLLGYLQGQKTVLTSELTDKDGLLKELAKDETRLKQDLQVKQIAHENLNSAIERIIQEEVRKRVEEARNAKPVAPAPSPPRVAEKPAAPVAGPAVAPTVAPAKSEAKASERPAAAAREDNMTSGFRLKYGKLPWPVENGFISRGYGRQKHPTLKNIEITNNGIDIRTEESATVLAVADGKVAGVQFIPGHDYTVIIQHGDYYTVYSNLNQTKLSKGDMVSAKQLIGTLSTNQITGASELHFEVWHEKERMNPAVWIKKG